METTAWSIIADSITIESIDYTYANKIYTEHHSYIPRPITAGTPVHHGVFLDGNLVGAISYSYMLCSSDICGYNQTEYMSVSRVCIVVNMSNLASCAMSKSQKKFTVKYASSNNIGLLVTYVIDSKDGSMFAALSDLGWKQDSYVEGHQAGNRPNRKIRNENKWRWVCELPQKETQMKQMELINDEFIIQGTTT